MLFQIGIVCSELALRSQQVAIHLMEVTSHGIPGWSLKEMSSHAVKDQRVASVIVEFFVKSELAKENNNMCRKYQSLAGYFAEENLNVHWEM